jgi:hypothetical protein
MVRRGLLGLLGAAAACLCLCTPPAPAQAPGEGGRPVVADGGTCLIAASLSGKSLYGYSVESGRWAGLAVENPDGSQLVPTLGSGLGFVVIGDRVHAYSGHAGHWATLETPLGREARLGPGRIRVDDGTKIHLFSSATGRWSSFDLGEDVR